MYKGYDLILAMSISWSLYGVLNILSTKDRNKHNRSFALSIILFMTIPIIDHLIKATPKTFNSIYPFLVITRNIYFMIGPLIWFYVTSLINPKVITKRVVLLHCIPFFVLVILSFKFSNFPMSNYIKSSRVQNFNYINVIRITGSSISAAVYGIFSLIQINKHKKIA